MHPTILMASALVALATLPAVPPRGEDMSELRVQAQLALLDTGRALIARPDDSHFLQQVKDLLEGKGLRQDLLEQVVAELRVSVLRSLRSGNVDPVASAVDALATVMVSEKLTVPGRRAQEKLGALRGAARSALFAERKADRLALYGAIGQGLSLKSLLEV